MILETVRRKREEFGCISLSSLTPLANTARMGRSRSTGNLLEERLETPGLDYKQCLIQEDEEEEERLEHFNSEFQQRMILSSSNENLGLARYKIYQ